METILIRAGLWLFFVLAIAAFVLMIRNASTTGEELRFAIGVAVVALAGLAASGERQANPPLDGGIPSRKVRE